MQANFNKPDDQVAKITDQIAVYPEFVRRTTKKSGPSEGHEERSERAMQFGLWSFRIAQVILRGNRNEDRSAEQPFQANAANRVMIRPAIVGCELLGYRPACKTLVQILFESGRPVAARIEIDRMINLESAHGIGLLLDAQASEKSDDVETSSNQYQNLPECFLDDPDVLEQCNWHHGCLGKHHHIRLRQQWQSDFGYLRKLTDLPWQGLRVRFVWRSRKFFCDSKSCRQKIFTERLSEVAAP